MSRTQFLKKYGMVGIKNIFNSVKNSMKLESESEKKLLDELEADMMSVLTYRRESKQSRRKKE